MKKSRFHIVSVFIFIAFSTLSCTDPVEFQGTESSNNSQYILDFDILNVTKSHDILLFEGDVVDVKIIKEDGEFDVSLQDSGNNYIYKGDNASSSEFSLNISSTDTYHIKVTGREAHGYVSFIIREK